MEIMDNLGSRTYSQHSQFGQICHKGRDTTTHSSIVAYGILDRILPVSANTQENTTAGLYQRNNLLN